MCFEYESSLNFYEVTLIKRHIKGSMHNFSSSVEFLYMKKKVSKYLRWYVVVFLKKI